ncbi:hypothetical protein CR970_01620 [Candidatus Saccharibacteria bacterium]|nr:MAG: hypothetical protein CR970_01620 [Candidatus Saccharibacteria bacterium]
MIGNLKTKSQGFTIIEVLIVLAIAGLIMLIVFLAVPALQRNSRNTQYKNDAASLLSAATEYTNNNNGTLPTSSDAATVAGLAKTQAITNLNVVTGGSAAVTPAFDTATIVTGRRCGTVGAGSVTPQAGPTRAMVIIYAVENSSGGIVAQCTES